MPRSTGSWLSCGAASRLRVRPTLPSCTASPYIPQLEEDNVRQGFLEPDQYERLLTELPDRLKALFVCAYHVGTRKGELRKTRWEQVDLEAHTIRLRAAQTKGKTARSLPIYGDMERWLLYQQESSAPDCPWVFHYRGGFGWGSP